MSIKNPFEKSTQPQESEEELKPEKLREKLKNPSYLPNHEDVPKAFETREEWQEFCWDKKKPTYEFLNKEFIDAFSNYLSQRAEELGATEENPVTVLEAGAGNGRLAHFVQQALEKVIPGKTKIIATDSGEWGIKPDFPVEIIKQEKALEKHRPDIVIVSWMPWEEDWTAGFRARDSVKEYLLIGGDCCGDDWETWGASLDDKKEKPYEKDGFAQERLDEISSHQICRTDDIGDYEHSSTVSFRRVQ